MKSGRYIGVMSGTSLDGVDVVLVAIDDNTVSQQASYCHPMPVELRQQILAVCQGQLLTLSQLGQLDQRLGRLFAEAVQALLTEQKLSAEEVIAIGCHGQTVWHEPASDAPHTMQIGDCNHIAAITGITVVGDFRRRDMALGGQGAPLVPLLHQALLMDLTETRMVLNIGGIANLSLLIPGEPVRGFDTGPGNMLLDAWCWKKHGTQYDHNGDWAGGGEVIVPLLRQMLSDLWFALPTPKSTGREYFNIEWLNSQLNDFPGLSARDIQRTLLELTATSIADQVSLHGGCQKLIVCGGGRHNAILMSRLAALIPGAELQTTDRYGLSGDDIEGLAFAWLACRTLSGLPGNLPSVTGARESTILGAIYLANRIYRDY